MKFTRISWSKDQNPKRQIQKKVSKIAEILEWKEEKRSIIMNFEFINEMNRSGNAVVTIDMHTGKVVAGNKLAHEMFGRPDKTFEFDRLLGECKNSNEFMENMKNHLAEQVTAELKGTHVVDGSGEKIDSDLIFDFLTEDKSHVIIRVCPVTDQKKFLLDTFIESRKHPAFTLNVNDNLRIMRGNKAFYASFACTKESMLEKYDNQFVTMLSEERHKEDETLILEALSEKPFDILDVSIQTARGEKLNLYYNKEKLRLLDEDWNDNLFCMLVEKDTPLEKLEAEWNFVEKMVRKS